MQCAMPANIVTLVHESKDKSNAVWCTQGHLQLVLVFFDFIYNNSSEQVDAINYS